MKKIILKLIFTTVSLFAFEVNTHQAITRCAVTKECSNSGGISNLENFVKHTELNTEEPIYQDEIFEKYHERYIDYVQKEGTGFEDWNITITPNYHGMIEAGVVLEDSIYHNAMDGMLVPSQLHAGDGRFNNHFYAAQFNSRAYCRLYSSVASTLVLRRFGVVAGNLADYMKTEKTLCLGLKQRTDNIDWVFNKNVNLGEGRVNDYGVEDSFEYFRKSFEGDKIERRKYQAKFFATLGFMSHMLQDLHSPAHVRDGAHALGDYLEIYGRYNKGFNLKDGNFNPANEAEIVSAIRDFNMNDYLNGMGFKSLEDFYYKEASWVSNNFFSEEHNSFETGNTQTGEGIEINNKMDRDTIFDLYNDHLDNDETHEEEASDQWNYIKTNGKVGEVYGPIKEGHDTVAFVEKGWFFTSEHMIVPVEYTYERNALGEIIGLKPVNNDYNKNANMTALKDTAVNVIPRAIASTQSMINFFFRAQIAASPIYGRRIYIFNDSNVSTLPSPEFATLKEGGKFYIYYMNDDNISKPIRMDGNGENIPYILANDLVVDSYTSFDLGDVFDIEKKIDGETRWIVVFDGNIGEDTGGSDKYEYGMRGVTADIARDRFERNDINNTVIDNVNNIEWQDESETLVDSWYAANRYCNNLVFAGYDNWGLPTQGDLLSIIKPRSNPYIYKKYFKHLGAVGYWSSNFHDNYPNANTASGINYGTGRSFEFDINTHMNVRCVRMTN